jgi:hypothetical protein
VISLRPLLAYLAVTPLFTCNAMVESFARCIEFPEALAPEYRVFTRLLSQKNLIEAREVLGGQAPWSWPTGSPPQPKASSDAVPLSGSRADS